MTISLKPLRVLKFLFVSILVLTILNLSGIYIKHFTEYEEVKEHLVRLVYFDAEQNFPTFFSALMLLFSSLLLAYISIVCKRQNKDAGYWMGLAYLFGFLAVDEAVSLHEIFIGPVRFLLDTKGFLYFAWVIPYTAFTIVLSVVYIRFLMKLSRKVRTLMIVSGGIYVLGALFLEMIGGHYYSLHGYERTYIFSLVATLEEFLEMAGISLFIYSLLVHIKKNFEGHSLKMKVKEKS